jgi:branched-chain amino acid transport system substrate-binding protein
MAVKRFRAKILVAALLGATSFAAGPASADITVGVILALTGPNSSLGIPYRRGLEALPKEVGGEKVNVIYLDDTSDPSTAVKNAQKLISDNKIDLLIGPSNTPAVFAVAPIMNNAKVPQISLSPVELNAKDSEWIVTIPQPGSIWILPILKDMQKRGVKTAAFIGFSDPWGDLCFNAFKEAAPRYGISIVAEERYARTDNSVTGQTLKLLAAKPDAIFVGGSGTPGALPHIALAERRWTGPTYGSPAVFNKDFLRLGGPAVENVMAVTGPVGAYEQLPDTNPIKKVSAEFVKSYEAANGAGSANGFAAYSYDAVQIFKAAAEKAVTKAKGGTPEFRQAFRDAIRENREIIGTQGIYNFKPDSPYGVDERAIILVKAEKGAWKLVP